MSSRALHPRPPTFFVHLHSYSSIHLWIVHDNFRALTLSWLVRLTFLCRQPVSSRALHPQTSFHNSCIHICTQADTSGLSIFTFEGSWENDVQMMSHVFISLISWTFGLTSALYLLVGPKGVSSMAPLRAPYLYWICAPKYTNNLLHAPQRTNNQPTSAFSHLCSHFTILESTINSTRLGFSRSSWACITDACFYFYVVCEFIAGLPSVFHPVTE